MKSLCWLNLATAVPCQDGCDEAALLQQLKGKGHGGSMVEQGMGQGKGGHRAARAEETMEAFMDCISEKDYSTCEKYLEKVGLLEEQAAGEEQVEEEGEEVNIEELEAAVAKEGKGRMKGGKKGSLAPEVKQAIKECIKKGKSTGKGKSWIKKCIKDMLAKGDAKIVKKSLVEEQAAGEEQVEEEGEEVNIEELEAAVAKEGKGRMKGGKKGSLAPEVKQAIKECIKKGKSTGKGKSWIKKCIKDMLAKGDAKIVKKSLVEEQAVGEDKVEEEGGEVNIEELEAAVANEGKGGKKGRFNKGCPRDALAKGKDWTWIYKHCYGMTRLVQQEAKLGEEEHVEEVEESVGVDTKETEEGKPRKGTGRGGGRGKGRGRGRHVPRGKGKGKVRLLEEQPEMEDEDEVSAQQDSAEQDTQ